MNIGLIGDSVEEMTRIAGAVDGMGAILARRFETLVASGAAAAAFGEILTEFRQSGGQLKVALPPVSPAPSIEMLHADEVCRTKTHAEYLEALLGGIDALVCCPGGIATLHELHHFLDAAVRASALDRAIVYLYDRDKYFAPWRLQLQVMVEAGGAPAEIERAIRPFESPRGLEALLSSREQGTGNKE